MRKLLVIDVDGVLVDYNKQYALGWEKAFGEKLSVVNQDAYWAQDVYGARHLDPEEVVAWREAQNYEYWATMEAMPGAYNLLYDFLQADYNIVACTALDEHWHEARAENLNNLFGDHTIKALICAGEVGKSTFVNALNADVFIDDYAKYFYNVKKSVKKILVDRSPSDPQNPNVFATLEQFDMIVNHIDEINP